MDVDVEIREDEVWFDPAALATEYGRDVFGSSPSPSAAPTPTIVPLTTEERRLDHNLREFHATPSEIAIAIQQLRNEEADGEPFLGALRELGARDRHARRIRNSVRFQRSTRPYVPPSDGPLVDIFPDLPTGPGGRSIDAVEGTLTSAPSLSVQDYRNSARDIIQDIRSIDPSYDSLALRTTNPRPSDRDAHLDTLRLERAALLWRTQQKVQPLQIEMLRYVQRQADLYYPLVVERYESGDLDGLNRGEAIGTELDAMIRLDLRELFASLGLVEDDVTAVNRAVRVTSGNNRFPDLRIADVFIDLSLEPKDARTDQVIAFFEANIAPTYVIIVRPTQVGRTRLITPPPRRYARN